MVDASTSVKILADLLAQKEPSGYTPEELAFYHKLKAEQARLPIGTVLVMPGDPEFCDF